jgi:hypothetical protein
MSDKGNGYIFLVQKSNMLVEIDSEDAKFNETFADYRGRQGKLTGAPYIDPDLKEEKEDANYDRTATFSFDEGQQVERQRRNNTAREFLLPGTHSKEIDIRKQQYSHLCLDNLMDDNANAIFILDCMEAQMDDETKLMKELELVTACVLCDESDEILTPAITSEQNVNLTIPDPKSQSEIDRMDPKDAKRFNDATIFEGNGMKSKNVFRNTTMDALPVGTTVYQSVVN